MFNKNFIAALAGLLLGACVPEGATVSQDVRLGQNPTLAGGSFSTGGGLTIALEQRDFGGVTGLCGVWAQSDRQAASTRGGAQRIISSAKVSIGDELLYSDLQFMTEVSPVHSYAGARAACVRTQRPWVQGDSRKKLSVAIPEQIVRTTSNNNNPMFRPTGPSAGAPAAPAPKTDPFAVRAGESGVVKMGANPTIEGFGYSNGGGFYIAVDLQNVGGRVAVCGAWSNDGKQSAYTPRLTSQLLQIGTIAMDRKVLVRNLSYMREMPLPNSYSGAPAKCRVTDVPWQDGFAGQEVEIRIPRKTFL